MDFYDIIWSYYQAHRRALPWRPPQLPEKVDGTLDPYPVLVSELMLQQTQAGRVVPKFQEFLGTYPTINILAEAKLRDVLAAWSGLGYNRRAKYLWQTARTIQENGGTFPKSRTELIKLPGIGPNTAGAILAYAFNRPEVFIETNIRSVYLHHFFAGQTAVPDTDITVKVQATLPPNVSPREWFYALMDYGAYLKSVHGNPNVRSKHYAKQSTFQGSVRQLRGAVLRELLPGPLSPAALAAALADERLPAVCAALMREGLIRREKDTFALA